MITKEDMEQKAFTYNVGDDGKINIDECFILSFSTPNRCVIRTKAKTHIVTTDNLYLNIRDLIKSAQKKWRMGDITITLIDRDDLLKKRGGKDDN